MVKTAVGEPLIIFMCSCKTKGISDNRACMTTTWRSFRTLPFLPYDLVT